VLEGWRSQQLRLGSILNALVERDKHSCHTIRENQQRGVSVVRDWCVHQMDVVDFDFSTVGGEIDLLAGGPPCQPFSIGGRHGAHLDERFPATFRTRETADLFLVLIAHLLKEGGRGAIVLPDGTLFGEGVKTRIKEKLLQDCNLHTIVRLPNGVFNPYTGIKTNLLFFTKGEPTETIWYYEHPYPAGYKSYSKTKPIRFEEFAPEQEWWDNREENEFAWQVSIADLKANNYNLDIKNPHKVDVEHADLDEMLAEHQKLMAELDEVRSKLKFELMEALEGNDKLE
jgi:type I restriction enzyme M protein